MSVKLWREPLETRTREACAALESHFHSSVRGAAERGKAEHFRVMFVRQIINPAEDRQVRIHFIFNWEIKQRYSRTFT